MKSGWNCFDLLCHKDLRREILDQLRLRKLSKDLCHALFQNQNSISDSRRRRGFLQQPQWFVHRLLGETKAPVMHGNHPAGVQVEEGASSIGGAGMNIAEGGWIVGANGEKRKLWRKPHPDLTKSRKIGSISGVVDRMPSSAQHVTAVAAVRVLQHPRSPVPRGYVSDGEITVTIAAPPVQLDHVAKTQVGDQIEDVLGNHHRRRRSPPALSVLHQRSQRGPMKMIEM